MSPSGKAEDIEAAAAAWFERREWSNWDAAAEAALQTWLSESTAHRIAFLRLEAAWERAERLKALGAGVPPGRVPARASFGFVRAKSTVPDSKAPPIVSGVTHNKGWWSGRRKWAVGVSSFASVLAFVVWYRSEARWHAYGTPVGTVAPVVLADGSRITLDSNTRIRVALDANQRLVRLDQGEALFDVAKDPMRPMIVEVADKRVTAIGTEFSVRRDSDEISVLVQEGRIRIDDGPGPDAANTTELDAGGEASTHGGEIDIEHVGLTEIERALSWREGYLEFHETPLPQVVAEFNRYRVQRIEIDDPRLNSIRIGGRFRCTDVDAFLALLEQGFPVVVTRDGNLVGLHRR
jgi:transmembrane sensor